MNHVDNISSTQNPLYFRLDSDVKDFTVRIHRQILDVRLFVNRSHESCPFITFNESSNFLLITILIRFDTRRHGRNNET